MKNKKILIIALFLILFCLLGYSKCFASVSYTYDGNEITLPEVPEKEGYTNYIIYYADDNPNIVNLKLFPTDLSYYPTVYKINGCLGINTYNNTSNCSAPSYYYNVEKGTDWAKTSDSGYIGVIKPSNIVACTTDIYYTDGNKKLDDEPFFQATPQVGIVAQQVETVEMSQVLQEIVGILPLIIVLLVSLVGLRKALKMLVTFLRRS